MAKDLRQRIIDTVQSGLNSTVYSLQAAVQTQPQGSAFYPTTLDQMASPIDVHLLLYIFIFALTLLVRQQEGHRACRRTVLLCK